MSPAEVAARLGPTTVNVAGIEIDRRMLAAAFENYWHHNKSQAVRWATSPLHPGETREGNDRRAAAYQERANAAERIVRQITHPAGQGGTTEGA